jgi:hypothetical protein
MNMFRAEPIDFYVGRNPLLPALVSFYKGCRLRRSRMVDLAPPFAYGCAL